MLPSKINGSYPKTDAAVTIGPEKSKSTSELGWK